MDADINAAEAITSLTHGLETLGSSQGDKISNSGKPFSSHSQMNNPNPEVTNPKMRSTVRAITKMCLLILLHPYFMQFPLKMSCLEQLGRAV